MTRARHILVVEDDEDIASALARGLKRQGYVVSATDQIAVAERILAQGCDAAIIDSMLGENRGEDLIRKMRKRGDRLPIIMLSALSGVEDRMRGLAAGADDYVAKPFELAELVARLRVQENRRTASNDELRIDADKRRVIRGDNATILTQRELDLLRFLIGRADRVLSRGEIFDALWLNEGRSAENVVDVYIGYLRRKLAPREKFGIEIKTIRGRGFVLTRNGGT